LQDFAGTELALGVEGLKELIALHLLLITLLLELEFALLFQLLLISEGFDSCHLGIEVAFN
jgi:hypothetical protein